MKSEWREIARDALSKDIAKALSDLSDRPVTEDRRKEKLRNAQLTLDGDENFFSEP